MTDLGRDCYERSLIICFRLAGPVDESDLDREGVGKGRGCIRAADREGLHHSMGHAHVASPPSAAGGVVEWRVRGVDSEP